MSAGSRYNSTAWITAGAASGVECLPLDAGDFGYGLPWCGTQVRNGVHFAYETVQPGRPSLPVTFAFRNGGSFLAW